MKYKNLTNDQILISLDRLTRFKNTKEKYLRVFADILISNLIEPKLKKSDIEKMDFALITKYVSEIFNNSIDLLSHNSTTSHQRMERESFFSQQQKSGYINLYLKDYENSIFVNDDETQLLLNNNINYISAIDLIPNDCPVNLKWLSVIARSSLTKNLKEIRSQYLLKFPIEEVILVEGITEEILLPVFAQKLGYDFYAKGIQIIAAGGKNQVVKMYYKLATELKIPIFVLLDKDAEENINQIKPRLRKNDRIHLVSCGEFEDLLPKSLIIKTVNSHFKNFLAISEEDLNINLPTARILDEIFKTRGLHEFKKAEFAKLVKENISSESDISPEIKAIIKEISLTNKMLDSKLCS